MTHSLFKTMTARPVSSAFRIFQILFLILAQVGAAIQGVQPALAAGGSYSIKWYAADPAVNRAPYLPTYVKQPPSSLACPAAGLSGGAGRLADPLANAVAYASPAISSNLDAVTSLAPKDLALGQIVPFEVEIVVSGSTAPENGVISFTPYWLTKTTSGDDFGYDPAYMVYCAFVDTADPGTSDPGGNAAVTSYTSTLANTGTSNEQIQGIFTISGLDDGDKIIVEIWVVLKSVIPAGSTGNVQTGLISAQTATGDTINTGNQTVPLLRVREFFTNNADVSITKSDSPDPVTQGQQLTYTLNVTNNSTDTVANGVVVSDTLDPNTTFVSGTWATGTCTASAGIVTCNLGALGPSQTIPITIVVAVSNTAPTNNDPSTNPETGTCTAAGPGIDLCNKVSVTAITSDPNTANNSDSEPTNVLSSFVPAPSLSLLKQISTSASGPWSSSINVTVGDSVYYQFTIANTGNVALSPVSVSDPDVSTASCTFTDPLPVGGTTTCVVGPITALEGTHVNTATASGGYGGQTYNSQPSSATYIAAAQVFPPDITLTKTADPTSVDEPGGDVTFTILVVNNSTSAATLDSLNDSVYGDLNGQGDCSVPQPLAADGGSYSCSFSAFVSGNAGEVHTNIATAVASNGGGSDTASDDATVTIKDVPAAIEIIKTANPTSVDEPGANVTFSFTIKNLSAVDVVTINSLSDSIYGDLNGQGDCSVPQTIPAGGSYSCSLTTLVSTSETNVVTASGLDDDGNPVSDSDDATVTVNDVPSSVLTTKTASPTSVPETGGDVTFTITVENTSAVDMVTINSVIDSVFGDVSASCAPALPASLLPGESVTCSFTEFISGDYPGSHTNVATASGQDDDGNPVSDEDQEEVPFEDVLPDISITKTANPTSIAETGGDVTFTFVVTNNSLEAATLDSLVDNLFGNLNGQGDCSVPQPLSANGGSYTCSITVFLAADDLAAHTNVVTATASDNDGNTDEATDDETVTFTDVAPEIRITKSASPTSVPETGGDVTFTFLVENIGKEDVSLTSLTDTVFGNLNGQGSCVLPQNILIGGSYSCSITVNLSADDLADHTNLATAAAVDDDGTQASDDDDEIVTFTDVLPDISISKTANPTSVPETGGDVTFTFVVTNHNSEAVTLTSLTDSVFGDLNGQGTCLTGGSIAGGGTYTCSITRFISGDFEGGVSHKNMVTADASDNDGNSDQASDDAVVDFTNATADIAISKVTVDGTTSGDGINIQTGESIQWRYSVTNVGNVTLSNITVTDNVSGVTATYVSGDTNNNGKLDLTETWIYEATGTAITGAYSNIGTASGSFTDGAGNVESDTATDNSSYFGADPQIAITKVTVDGSYSGDGGSLLSGESIQWRYSITNVGNVPLSNVTVTDSVSGVTPTYVSGDTNSNGKLDLTETWIYEATGTAITGNYSNTGTTSGSFTDSGGHSLTDTASDTSSYFGANPQIDIVKKTVGVDGSEGDNVFEFSGATVTWKYYVTNTGNVPLSNITVTDNKGLTVTCPKTTLAVGESMTCTATGTNSTAAGTWYNNIGTASGSFTDSGDHSRTVTDSDSSAYYSGMPGSVTNSQLCDFGNTFRLVFTPDSRYYTSSYLAYKLSDSNPGQFFYNVFYTNAGSTDTVTMEIPYPFVTQGANPIHVYGGLTVNPYNTGTPSPDNLMNCFVPNNTLAAYGYTITLASYTDTNGDGKIGFGDVYLVNVPAELGFQYINIHLDYGLEKTDGWVKQGSNAVTDQTKYPGRVDIKDLTAYTFKAYSDGVLISGSTDTIYNQNVFKQVKGFGGLVYAWDGTEYVPLAGAKVRLYKGTSLTSANLLETMSTDADGWYLSNYVHKGKAATYSLALMNGNTILKTIQVTAGGSLKFGEGIFYIGGPTPNP